MLTMYNLSLWGTLKHDLIIHAGKSGKLRTLIFDQRLRMLRWIRIKLAAVQTGIPIIVPIIDILLLRWFSSQIGNKVEIGLGVKFAHPIGIVLGESCVIGDSCTIYQNVTLGGHSRRKDGLRYPILENNVTIFPNSVIVGGITVGAGATVGACSMVSRSVMPGDTVGGVPARSIKLSTS